MERGNRIQLQRENVCVVGGKPVHSGVSRVTSAINSTSSGGTVQSTSDSTQIVAEVVRRMASKKVAHETPTYPGNCLC